MILVFPKEKAKAKKEGPEKFDWTPADWDIGASFSFSSFFVLRWVSGHGQIILLPNAYQLHTSPLFLPSKPLTLLSSHPDCEARVVQGSTLW